MSCDVFIVVRRGAGSTAAAGREAWQLRRAGNSRQRARQEEEGEAVRVIAPDILEQLHLGSGLVLVMMTRLSVEHPHSTCLIANKTLSFRHTL